MRYTYTNTLSHKFDKTGWQRDLQLRYIAN